MRSSKRLLPVVLLAAVMSGCTDGERVRPAGRRVISLAPSVTRILDALGARDEVVGVDLFSQRVPGFTDLPSVGGLYAPDLEKILSLRPTVVLAIRTEQQRMALERLRDGGLLVRTIDPHTLEEVFESFVELGGAVGRADSARRLVAAVKEELEGVRAAVGGRGRPTTALLVERDPLYVVGSGSFAHELIEIAGGRNVFADLASPYPRVSLEALAARTPAVLIDTAVDPARPGAREAAARFWAAFSWVRRVEVVPQGPLTVPGPDLGAAARLLADRIHPGSIPAEGSARGGGTGG